MERGGKGWEGRGWEGRGTEGGERRGEERGKGKDQGRQKEEVVPGICVNTPWGKIVILGPFSPRIMGGVRRSENSPTPQAHWGWEPSNRWGNPFLGEK